jgi:hypothetical protein
LSPLGEGAEAGERGLGRQTTSQAVRVEYIAVEDFILGAYKSSPSQDEENRKIGVVHSDN